MTVLLFGKFQKSLAFKKNFVFSSFQYNGTNLARDNFRSVCRPNNPAAPSLPRTNQPPSHFSFYPVLNQSAAVKCILVWRWDGVAKHFLYQCETVTNRWVLIFVTDIVIVPNSVSSKIETCGEVFRTLSTSLTTNAVNFRILSHMLTTSNASRRMRAMWHTASSI